ncbi:alanine-alpha-ketoisovalerate aminotransferase [Candidatus Scalindua japonica]|uniref:Alanine-alpha-ketoisovalerate aminotransferase n=1 Tax=Candidatus Scalindua japonica TaxID=1284222 RepID=A0A286TZ40_9BACT|nr:alanine-alpha-ketoisovalerate aminotransferase [Candidatus Scalindua japonica]
MNGTATMDAIIICEGDITFNGNSDIIGGIIHYGGVINGNGNPTAVTVENDYFRDLSTSMPIITVQSLSEAVAAN